MITLIRGLPGSGKSTLARKMLAAGEADAHFEADMYFEDRPFDPKLLGKAHGWCQTYTEMAHKAGYHVVVSNTFTQLWEMEPYFDMDPDARVIECTGDYGSIHDVPEAQLRKMRMRWESMPYIDYRGPRR